MSAELIAAAEAQAKEAASLSKLLREEAEKALARGAEAEAVEAQEELAEARAQEEIANTVKAAAARLDAYCTDHKKKDTLSYVEALAPLAKFDVGRLLELQRNGQLFLGVEGFDLEQARLDEQLRFDSAVMPFVVVFEHRLGRDVFEATYKDKSLPLAAWKALYGVLLDIVPEGAASTGGGPKPLSRQQYQENEILRVIAELRYDPKALPTPKPGAEGVKAQVRAKVMERDKQGVRRYFQGSTVFDKAWDRLRRQGAVRDK